MPKSFDVEICRKVELEKLGWPAPGAAGAEGMDSGFGGNRAYSDLRSFGWRDARRVLDKEQALIARISASDDPEGEYDEIADELYEDDEGLYGLDLGVAAAVVALSAARCIPFSSCNGGAFGEGHLELYPLVAFYARTAHLEALLAAAEDAGCGLENGSNGCLVIFAGNIESLQSFAAGMIKRAPVLRGLHQRTTRSTQMSEASSDQQLKLL
jgi:hypothetical protein